MSSLLHRFFSSYSAKVSHCCGFSCEAWALGCAGFSSCGLQTDSSLLSRQGSPKAAPYLWNAHSSQPLTWWWRCLHLSFLSFVSPPPGGLPWFTAPSLTTAIITTVTTLGCPGLVFRKASFTAWLADFKYWFQFLLAAGAQISLVIILRIIFLIYKKG